MKKCITVKDVLSKQTLDAELYQIMPTLPKSRRKDNQFQLKILFKGQVIFSLQLKSVLPIE